MQRWTALGRAWIVLGLLAACAAGAAVIYKWTDADGVVHYSDQAMPGAEKIVTASGSTNGIGGPTRGSNVQSNRPQGSPGGADYTVFKIESPANEQVFFGDEIVPVRLRLEPGLGPNQTITWHLNGKQLSDQAPTSTGFALQTLPRGTYAVAATLTDMVSGETQSTESVTFYVRQPSELSPQHKKP